MNCQEKDLLSISISFKAVYSSVYCSLYPIYPFFLNKETVLRKGAAPKDQKVKE